MTAEELIAPGPARALAALLDRDVDLSEPLPALWHWVYLLDRPRQDELGRDGHRRTSTLAAPPEPAHEWRRMFAGGRVEQLGGLRVGDPATRRSRVRDRVRRTGRSGELEFVTVEHELVQGGRPVVREEQDIVYRPVVATERPDPVAPGPDAVDPTLLFRFSALTYNAHRIHYDRDYATGVEGYPGLLVHGPLQALLMAEAAGPGVRRFDYRLVAPLFDFQGMQVRAERAGDVVRTGVTDRSGRPTATGTAS
jgi:3-methylfumaryl-CoA hydratase